MKPIRLVVVNGCSMTFGSELKDARRSGWPAIVADDLGADLVNLGANAGSNRRVVRLIVERLHEVVAKRDLVPDEVLVLAMWTDLNRYEIYSGAPDRHGGLPTDVLDDGWMRLHVNWIARKDPATTAWYRHLQSDRGDVQQFLLDWILFEAWLAATGVRYGFLWAFRPDEDLLNEFPRYVSQLNLEHIISDASGMLGPSLMSVGERLDDLGPGLHPLERSQSIYARESLLPWLERTVLAPG